MNFYTTRGLNATQVQVPISVLTQDTHDEMSLTMDLWSFLNQYIDKPLTIIYLHLKLAKKTCILNVQNLPFYLNVLETNNLSQPASFPQQFFSLVQPTQASLTAPQANIFPSFHTSTSSVINIAVAPTSFLLCADI